MKNKFPPLLRALLAVAFWLGVWEIAAICVNHSYFLPSIEQTLLALIEIITDKGFFVTICMTFIRVVLGLIIGSALGIALGIISSKVSAVSYLLSPILVLVKSTPVASFIILLWATLNGNALAVFIALLMVFPIIYQNTISAFDNIDQDLEEVCIVYRFSWWKRMRYLLIPTMLKFLVPAFITSVGLAWKAEVAAEIVGYVKDSIGAHINDAFPHTDTVFAWTLVIIAFSLALEYATRYLLRRIKTDD